ARVERDDAISSRRPRDVQIVHTDNARTANVNHLAVEHVLDQQDLPVTPLEALDVYSARRKRYAARRDLGDLGDRDKELTPAGARHDADDLRIDALLHPRDQVLHTRDAVTAALDDRSGDDLRKRHEIGSVSTVWSGCGHSYASTARVRRWR